MQLPVRTPETNYNTLEDIQLRKEQLAAQIQQDNKQFSSLWNQLFVKRQEASKGEWIAGIITNGITAVDTFLLVRKLFKNYGHIFHKSK